MIPPFRFRIKIVWLQTKKEKEQKKSRILYALQKCSRIHNTTGFVRCFILLSYNGSRGYSPWTSTRSLLVPRIIIQHLLITSPLHGTGQAEMPQISFAYWSMVRSLLNLPLPAVFKMDILIHFFLSLSWKHELRIQHYDIQQIPVMGTAMVFSSRIQSISPIEGILCLYPYL